MTLVMDGLSEHLGRDERNAAFRHVKPLAIRLTVDADGRSCRQAAVLVDHRAPEHDMAADIDVGEDDRFLDRAIAMNAHPGE